MGSGKGTGREGKYFFWRPKRCRYALVNGFCPSFPDFGSWIPHLDPRHRVVPFLGGCEYGAQDGPQVGGARAGTDRDGDGRGARYSR